MKDNRNKKQLPWKLKGDFHCSVIFCVRKQVNFKVIKKIEAVYGRSQIKVKVEPRLDFNLLSIASILFARVKLIYVRT